MDTHTLLLELYFMIDDFCQSHLEPETRPGPYPSLSRSKAMTLGLFSQWQRFRSERDFYRYAQQQLHPLFPRLTHRSQFSRFQFNRLMRRHHHSLTALFVNGVGRLKN